MDKKAREIDNSKLPLSIEVECGAGRFLLYYALGGGAVVLYESNGNVVKYYTPEEPEELQKEENRSRLKRDSKNLHAKVYADKC